MGIIMCSLHATYLLLSHNSANFRETQTSLLGVPRGRNMLEVGRKTLLNVRMVIVTRISFDRLSSLADLTADYKPEMAFVGQIGIDYTFSGLTNRKKYKRGKKIWTNYVSSCSYNAPLILHYGIATCCTIQSNSKSPSFQVPSSISEKLFTLITTDCQLTNGFQHPT